MGGGNPKSTTEQALPKWLQPYAKGFIESYRDEAFTMEEGKLKPKEMPENLTMQTAGFTPEQEAAFGNIEALTGGAQGLANIGAGNAAATLGGAYLHPGSNPYLDATYDRAARKLTDAYSTATAPSIMASAQKAGQFGSSAMEELMGMSRYDLGENLANLGTGIYGGNYAAERDRMLQTQGMLPETIGAMYSPQTYLAGVGAQRQDLQQTMFDTDYANAANAAEWPFNLLSGFGAAIGQAAGGGGTSKTTTSGGGMSVICTELHRQGRMDDATYDCDTRFGAGLPAEVIRGYHLFGIPIANAMRRSRIITVLLAPVALSWARTMRARAEGHPDQETLVGRLLLRYGVPFCGWLGRERRLLWNLR